MSVIEQLLRDNIRGASLIFKDALRIFVSLPDETLISTTREGTRLLKERFQFMGLFHTLEMRTLIVHTPAELRRELNSLLHSLERNIRLISRIGGFGLRTHTRILTISYSSLVRDLILKGAELNKDPSVLCLRSGPANEGEKLARDLNTFGVKTTVIEDDEVTTYIRKTNLVLAGCDFLGPDFFINKRGTGNLVRVAEIQKIPIWITADSHRRIDKEISPVPFDPVFEKVPLSQTMTLVTEQGFQTPKISHTKSKSNLTSMEKNSLCPP